VIKGNHIGVNDTALLVLQMLGMEFILWGFLRRYIRLGG